MFNICWYHKFEELLQKLCNCSNCKLGISGIWCTSWKNDDMAFWLIQCCFNHYNPKPWKVFLTCCNAWAAVMHPESKYLVLFKEVKQVNSLASIRFRWFLTHVALRGNFSGLVCCTDPVKVSKNVASLLVCTRKKVFWLGNAGWLWVAS